MGMACDRHSRRQFADGGCSPQLFTVWRQVGSHYGRGPAEAQLARPHSSPRGQPCRNLRAWHIRQKWKCSI
eukprot:6771980-Pyramimonas_sp.AAC.1